MWRQKKRLTLTRAHQSSLRTEQAVWSRISATHKTVRGPQRRILPARRLPLARSPKRLANQGATYVERNWQSNADELNAGRVLVSDVRSRRHGSGRAIVSHRCNYRSERRRRSKCAGFNRESGNGHQPALNRYQWKRKLFFRGALPWKLQSYCGGQRLQNRPQGKCQTRRGPNRRIKCSAGGWCCYGNGRHHGGRRRDWYNLKGNWGTHWRAGARRTTLH